MTLASDVAAVWQRQLAVLAAVTLRDGVEHGMLLLPDGKASRPVRGEEFAFSWDARRELYHSHPRPVGFVHSHAITRAWLEEDSKRRGYKPTGVDVTPLFDVFSGDDEKIAATCGHDFECVLNVATMNLVCVPKPRVTGIPEKMANVTMGIPSASKAATALWLREQWLRASGATVTKMVDAGDYEWFARYGNRTVPVGGMFHGDS